MGRSFVGILFGEVLSVVEPCSCDIFSFKDIRFTQESLIS